MTNLRFPFQRLPNDLCSMVLKTMERHEMMAYSLTSKKAFSLVQTIRLPLEESIIRIVDPGIFLQFDHIFVKLTWRIRESGEEMRSLKDIPDNVSVRPEKIRTTSYTWSHQGKSIEDWVHHLCSIFRCERYEAVFHIKKIRYDTQSLRNTFPKLRGIGVRGFTDAPSDQDIQSAQNILRAFLPYVEYVRLSGAPLRENLSIQHIGIMNLKKLMIESRNPKFDDLLTWNVEWCTIHAHQITYRNLNRFFKLWKMGSNPKLKCLLVHGFNVADWNALMKGLQAENAESDKEFVIQNCYGMRAKIRHYNDTPRRFSVNFTVLN